MRAFTLLLIGLTFTFAAYAIPPEAKVSEQPNAPVKISAYNAQYSEGGRYSSGGIHHTVIYSSQSKKKITAVQFGFVSFNVWNEFLDQTNGVTIEDLAPGAASNGEWVTNTLSDFTFLTGFAYVSKVRFEDDTIWVADLKSVLRELQGIELDFDMQKLEGKKSN